MCYSLLLVGHGSRDRNGVDEFLRLSRLVIERRGGHQTAIAFLEFARPTIAQAIERLVYAGANRVVVQPVMLFAAGHVKIDIPREVAAAQRRWPNTQFILSQPLGNHERLTALARLRWDESNRYRIVTGSDTALLVAGRGSRDSDADAELERIAERLGKEYGVTVSMACYSGLSRPLVPEALDRAAMSSICRIVLQPFFLFDGVLVKQLHAAAAAAAERYPEKQFASLQHLGPHPLLADAVEALSEAAVQRSIDCNEIHDSRDFAEESADIRQ